MKRDQQTREQLVDALSMERYNRRMLVETELNSAIRTLSRLARMGCSCSSVEDSIDGELELLMALAKLLNGKPKCLRSRVENLARSWDEAEYSQGTLAFISLHEDKQGQVKAFEEEEEE